MVKALIKKQYYESFRSYFVNQKTGKARSKGAVGGMFVLFAALMLFLSVVFFGLSFVMGDLLKLPGYEWLYYSVMGMLSIALGTFGSVFNTYASLYLAKDNELLLAMPIPPSVILSTRMSLVLGMSLLYSGIVWIPAVIYAWLVTPFSLTAVVFDLLLIPLLAVLVTVLTCALGWVVALISARVKNKSFLVVILSLLFFCGYYYICFNMNDLLQTVAANGEALGNGLKVWGNLIYQLGRGAEGAVLPMLLFSGITLGLFGLCFWILSKSFVRIVTKTPTMGKTAAKQRSIKSRGIKSALYRRELKRFTSSPTYMLNCGLGIFMLLLAAVMALVKQELIVEVLAAIGEELPEILGILPFTILSSVCMIVSINTISTPSISLEGRNLWILRSLPVTGRQVLEAKRNLHVSMNVWPALLAVAAVSFAMKLELVTAVLIGVYVWMFVWFTGSFGLVVGVLRPNFHWSNETMPIKQSLNVVICWLAGWVVVIATCGGCYLLRNVLDLQPGLGLMAVVLGLVDLGLNRWLNTAGAARFDAL